MQADPADRAGSARRMFFKRSGAVAAGMAVGIPAAGVSATAHAAQADAGRTTLPYPQQKIATATKLTVNEPLAFSYPDEASPCALIKTGRRVTGGVGPDGDIVAFSTLCTHMGCPVVFDPSARSFKCGCHYSQFDHEMGGQMICGQATENLPQVTLSYGADGTITAVGVQGLIYGRQSNIL